MKINEVAKLSGVTVRTLHYYDEIGLLKPSEICDNGYRIYSDTELETLQQILFFRELDFSLSDIKTIMQNKNYDKNHALKQQKELLTKKRDRLNDLIKLCDLNMEGKHDMSFKQFDMTEIEQYKIQAKEQFGDTKEYAQSVERTKNHTANDWQNVKEETAKIMKKFADIRHLSPSSNEAQALVKEWQDYISKNFYDCSNEVLAGLAQMYIADERFTKNIDEQGEGTAKFISQAIEFYCK